MSGDRDGDVQEDCATCDGNGLVCVGCSQHEDACICEDGFEETDCPDCDGTGMVDDDEDDDE